MRDYNILVRASGDGKRRGKQLVRGHVVRAKLKDGTEVDFGLRKEGGGWKCDHVRSGRVMDALSSYAPLGHKVLLRDAKRNVVELAVHIEVANFRNLVSRVEVLNPEFM